jgi:signal transduction histidine kinase
VTAAAPAEDQARLAEAAGGVGAPDLFLFRRVSASRFVHFGGVGRGEGWAGVVELVVEDEPLVREAIESETPVRVSWPAPARVFGPYWASAAALVPVSHDVLAVFGRADGPLAELGDDELLAAGEAAAAHIHNVSPAKRLADELEVLHGVRDLMHCAATDVPSVMQHIVEHSVDALSCEACLLMLFDRGGVARTTRRGVVLNDPDEALATALRSLPSPEPSAAFCVQEAVQQPLPAPLDSLAATSYYLLPVGDIGSLLLVHTQVAPRGFTLLCQELGANLASSAETMLRAAMSRELSDRIQQAQKLESLVVLAGGIAHDFNNLLVGVLGNAELAREELAANSPAAEALEQIELAAQRAAALSRQMLAYSGKGRFVVEPVDLRDLVDSMLTLFSSVVAKSTTVAFEPGPEPAVVEADGTELRQVLVNLVTNASEALDGAGGTVTIRTGVCEPGGDVRRHAVGAELAPGAYAFLEVADHGLGMDDETRAKIFEPYFSTKFTGRGLGLAAALGIVRAHGGAIHVASTAGEGTVVTALLPLSESSAYAVHSRNEPDLRAHAVGTVLVVDDESLVRDVTARTLQSAGYSVVLASSGEEALDLVTRQNGSLAAIVLDLTMQGVGGAEVLSRLRAGGNDLPVLLTSGYSDLDPALLDQDGVGFIQKPYRIGELLTRLRSLVR